MMRLTTERQIPFWIRACADAHRLGSPRIVYETHKESRLHLFFAPLALFVGCMIIGIYVQLYDHIFSWWPTWKANIIIGLGFAWLVIGLWFLLSPLITPHLRVYLCAKGLIYQYRGRQVIRWDQIKHAAKNIEIDKHSNLCTVYRLERQDGKVFTLPDKLPYIDRLYGFIEKEIVKHLFPNAILTLQTQGVLDFADIQLTTKGIGLKQGRRVLPWSEFERVKVDDTTLSIYRKGEKWEWATLNISNIPNTRVLQRLVEYIINGKEIQPEEPQQPSYVQTFEAGFDVFFGQFSLNKTGISIGNNVETIPWNEVETFGISESEVIIKRSGAAHQWYTFPLWSITDVPLLKQLLDYVLFQRYE